MEPSVCSWHPQWPLSDSPCHWGAGAVTGGIPCPAHLLHYAGHCPQMEVAIPSVPNNTVMLWTLQLTPIYCQMDVLRQS